MRIRDGVPKDRNSWGKGITKGDYLLLGTGLFFFLLSGMVWFFVEKGTRWESLETWIVAWTGGKQARGVVWYAATTLSDLGHGLFLGALLWNLWIWGMNRERLQEGILWLLFSGLACSFLKFLVDRDRPFGAGPHSWPSGHSAAVFSMALFLGKGCRRPWAALYLFLSVLVGGSRVFHLRHYPSDVLGGFGLAALLGPLVRRIPPFFPKALEERFPRQVALGIGLFVFLVGVQGMPQRPDPSVGFVGILLFLGLSGLFQEKGA